MVPLETLIFFPASSCDSPSKSTSLSASSSAGSMYIGSVLLIGKGVNLFIVGTCPRLTGFGNLPLLPRLRLGRHAIFRHL